MDKNADVRKPIYSSITEDEKDIIFLHLTEFAHNLRKPKERLTLSEDIFVRKNDSNIFNDYIEVFYTTFLQFRFILFPTMQEIMNKNKKVLIFNCSASPLFEESDFETMGCIHVNYNSTSELINKIQCLDTIIRNAGWDVGLVIVDKINFFYNKNIYINISQDYFKQENRLFPIVMKKPMNNNSKNSRKISRHHSLMKTEFMYMETAIINLFKFQMKHNFTLIISQYDFSREKFLSSLKFSQKGALKLNFDIFSFTFQNRILNPFSVQFINPNEEELNEDVNAFCALRRENDKIVLCYNDQKNDLVFRNIPLLN